MKSQLLAKSVTALIMFFAATPTYATTLTFDEMRSPNCDWKIPNPYMGFNWNGWRAADVTEHVGLPTSGPNLIFSFDTSSIFTTSGANINFIGAYLCGSYKDGLHVEVIGKRDGITIYDSTVTTIAHTASWFEFNFFGIDELVFTGFGGIPVGPYDSDLNGVSLDNFTYENFDPIPEPSTILLLALGLLGLAIRKRQRQN
ncbi:MAG: PEP-CTERM sorting domain-containing protein [Geobacter sp.]|nr:PEP-CTERM sorting domain-containing protein [Geobacter sp.]